MFNEMCSQFVVSSLLMVLVTIAAWVRDWMWETVRDLYGRVKTRRKYRKPWYLRKRIVRLLTSLTDRMPRDQVYEDRGVLYILYSNFPMYDWDLEPGQTHAELLSQIRTLWDQHQYSIGSLRVYRTPNGYRAFGRPISWMCLDDVESVDQGIRWWVKCAKNMEIDPAYIAMVEARKAWACRVSPKKGREGDFVATFECHLGYRLWDDMQRWGDKQEGLIRQHDTLCRVHRKPGVKAPDCNPHQEIRVRVLWDMDAEPWDRARMEQLLRDMEEEGLIPKQEIPF